ncbi:hypothetical protein DFH09DRAFT_1083685 [Mycena vulgaris]|nr:hypothetical protein DFH09DRAFT_1083685 [Mycena vulgaris]
MAGLHSLSLAVLSWPRILSQLAAALRKYTPRILYSPLVSKLSGIWADDLWAPCQYSVGLPWLMAATRINYPCHPLFISGVVAVAAGIGIYDRNQANIRRAPIPGGSVSPQVHRFGVKNATPAIMSHHFPSPLRVRDIHCCLPKRFNASAGPGQGRGPRAPRVVNLRKFKRAQPGLVAVRANACPHRRYYSWYYSAAVQVERTTNAIHAHMHMDPARTADNAIFMNACSGIPRDVESKCLIFGRSGFGDPSVWDNEDWDSDKQRAEFEQGQFY